MIQEGDFAIFKKGETLKIFQINKNKQIMLDRFKCCFDSLINQPWGMQYEIIDKKFHRKAIEKKFDIGTFKEDKDNRNLIDESINQKLSKDDIEEMKVDLDGEEIIEKLIENSASFQQKTEYSQEKYLKRKKQKYMAVYQILKPSMRSLCDFYMQGNMKRKILNMRIDTIAQLLSYSNVAAHRNVLVLESCKGLLLAAIAERLGGHGNIINLSPNGGDNTTKQTLEQMNFSDEIKKVIHNFPLENVDKLDEYLNGIKSKIEVAEDGIYKEKQINILKKVEIVYDLLKNKKIDCLIIATRYRTLPIVQKLIDFVDLNRWIVIFSPIQEPLIECHQFLRENQKAINMELSDSWLREYQVLPDRTHPKMMMDCCSGFLLTGITCDS